MKTITKIMFSLCAMLAFAGIGFYCLNLSKNVQTVAKATTSTEDPTENKDFKIKMVVYNRRLTGNYVDHASGETYTPVTKASGQGQVTYSGRTITSEYDFTVKGDTTKISIQYKTLDSNFYFSSIYYGNLKEYTNYPGLNIGNRIYFSGYATYDKEGSYEITLQDNMKNEDGSITLNFMFSDWYDIAVKKKNLPGEIGYGEFQGGKACSSISESCGYKFEYRDDGAGYFFENSDCTGEAFDLTKALPAGDLTLYSYYSLKYYSPTVRAYTCDFETGLDGNLKNDYEFDKGAEISPTFYINENLEDARTVISSGHLEENLTVEDYRYFYFDLSPYQALKYRLARAVRIDKYESGSTYTYNDYITNSKINDNGTNLPYYFLGSSNICNLNQLNLYLSNQYQITYDLNYNGLTSQKCYTYDTKVTPITDPTRQYYTFKGWYRNSDCTGSAFNFSTYYMEDEDFTLYAKWEAKEYSVTVNIYDEGDRTPNIESGEYSQAPVLDNNVATLRLNSSTGAIISNGSTIIMTADDERRIYFTPNQDKKFRLRYLLKNGLNTINNDFDSKLNQDYCELSMSDLVLEGTETDANITLNFIFSDKYNISYQNIYEDDQKVVKTFIYHYGEQIKSYTPERVGYKLSGWFSDETCTTAYTFPATMPDENITVYADWKKIYTVSFYDDQGKLLGTETPEYGGSVSFEAPEKVSTAQYDYTFDKWVTTLGGETSADLSNVTSDMSVYAKYIATTRKYTITSTAGENGTISESCEVEYGESQTFYIAPNTSYRIESILIDGVALSGTAFENAVKTKSFTFENVAANRTISVTFERNVFTVNFYNENGSLIISQNPNYGEDLSAYKPPAKSSTVQYEYTFDKWVTTLGGEEAADLTNITADMNVYAKFNAVLRKYTVTVNINESSYGTVSQTVLNDVEYGTTITKDSNNLIIGSQNVVATPVSNTEQFIYYFDNWTCNAVVKGNETVTANFKRRVKQFTLISTVDGSGVISPSGEISVDYGTNQKYTFAPNQGYHVSKIWVDSVELNAVQLSNAIENGYTFSNVTNQHTIKVKFEINQYTIKVVQAENGRITLAQESYEYGSSAIFSITADQGYYIGYLIVDGSRNSVSGKVSEKTYSFNNIQADHSISAVFEANGDISYTVKHYQESLTETDVVLGEKYYVLTVSDIKYGTTGELTKALTNSYNGFEAQAVTQKIILGDGTTEVDIFYDRKMFSVTLNTSDGIESVSGEGDYKFGTTVIVSAQTSEGYNWKAWESSNETDLSDSELQEYSFLMPAKNITLSALAEIQKFQVSFYDEDGNLLTTKQVAYGSSINFDAPEKTSTAQFKYIFDKWVTEKGGDVEADLSSVKSDLNVYASYVESLRKYTVTINVNNALFGSVSKTSLTKIDYGTEISSYENKLIVGGNVIIATVASKTAQYTFAFENWAYPNLVESDVTVTANFSQSINKYKITWLNADDTILLEQQFEYGALPRYEGQTPKLEQTEQYNFTFIGWSETIVAVEGDKTYKALYATKLNKFEVNANAGANGQISPNGKSDVEYGSDITFVFTPSTGYFVSEILVDQQELEGEEFENAVLNGFTFKSVKHSHTISVAFEILTFKIKISIQGNGNLVGDDLEQIIAYGQNRTLILKPEIFWIVKKVIVNGQNYQVVDNTVVLENITQDMTVEIVFGKEEDEKPQNMRLLLIILLIVFILIFIILLIMYYNRSKKRELDNTTNMNS